MSNPQKTLRLGIIGCGDFLRLQEESIRASAAINVVSLYDPMTERSRHYAAKWPGARVCASAEEILEAADVDVAAVFVPPWIRQPLLERAARNGKHIITTKPLAPGIKECKAMIAAVGAAGVCAGVIYNRTANRQVETLKSLFATGRLGRLALFKQDWIHHYPQWNTWALDPAKNGGPFMDAMIHNLNIVRYLMGRPATGGTLFSDRHAHPDLPCADTEFLKLDFDGNGAAHLFITWAADLRHDSGGNYREHIDYWYAVTDQGWRITEALPGGDPGLVASRLGQSEKIPWVDAPDNPFDELSRWIGGEIAGPKMLASLREAAEDIRIIRQTGAQPGTKVILA
jgi:predicted dehydrogenase